MQERYKGKKLLLIAPVFFGYYLEIIKEACKMGMDADYICDAPSNSNWYKAIGRINKKLISGASARYFENTVIPEIKAKRYDYVLLVAGMTFAFDPEMVEKLRMEQNKAVFIMYQWDSEANLPFATGIHKYFDRIYSFDRTDCMETKMYKFLPLFYTRMYEEIGGSKCHENKYDCMYIGTAHPQKFKNINDMAQAVSDYMPKQLVYHYMPSKLKYYYHKLTAPEYKGVSQNEFEFKRIYKDELKRVFELSNCILDAPQEGQTGLTIRTLECLGAKKKLITSNADIVNYDFYRPENILVFNGEIDKGSLFFKSDYKELPKKIYKKYSLKSWLLTMLSA